LSFSAGEPVANCVAAGGSTMKIFGSIPWGALLKETARESNLKVLARLLPQRHYSAGAMKL